MNGYPPCATAQLATGKKPAERTKAERYFATKAGYNLALGNPGQGIRFAAAQGETFLKEYFR
jgi:hypothetical protein